ncbi:MAG: HAD hydrolase-like protein [Candidatus Baldrarchaeia archaeon]
MDVLNIKPEEAVVIGDNLQYDVLLPKALGMHAILLDREGEKLSVKASNVTAEDLRDAVDILLDWL